MTPETYPPSRRRWLALLSRRPRPRRRLGRQARYSPAVVPDVPGETLEGVVLFAQSEGSDGPLASGRYRR